MSRFRPYAIFALRMLIGVGMLAVAIKLVDADVLFDAMVSIRPLWFFMAIVVSALASIVVPAIITRTILKAGNFALRLGDLVKINFAMRFYVLTLPHVVTVGMRWLRYRGPTKGKGWEVAALILFERVVQFTVLVLSTLCFLLVGQDRLPEGLEILIPVSFAFSVLGIFVLASFLSSTAFTWMRTLSKKLLVFAPEFVSRRVELLTAAIADYQRLGNRHVSSVLVWSVIAYMLTISSAYMVSVGMNVGLGFADIGWIRSVVFLLMVLPITVGGIGVREIGFATLLYFYGVDESRALAFPLILLAIQLLLGLIGAVIECVRLISARKTDTNAAA